MKATVNNIVIELVQNDILTLRVAAFVHVTDTNLAVSPALLALSGPSLQRECIEIGWCEVGSAVITGAGNLHFEKIIHCVGPRWGEGSERGKLANSTWACLRLAETNRLRSVALPAISSGVLGYPIENCAKTMLEQIINFTFEELQYLQRIVVCLEYAAAMRIFHQEFQQQLRELQDAGEGQVKV